MELCISNEPVRIARPGGQVQFVEDWEHRIVALEGGWWAGKTYAGSGKLATLHQYNAFRCKKPYCRQCFSGKPCKDARPTFCNSLVVASSYGEASDYCIPALAEVLEENNLSWRWIAGSNATKGSLSGPLMLIPDLGTYKNPSVILVRSAQHPESITGFTVAQAWGDESARWGYKIDDPKSNAVLQMYGRVRDERAKFRQILFTYTNEGDHTFIYEEIHKSLPDRAVYTAKTRDNPTAMDSGYYQAQLTALPPELAEQYLDGKAVHLAGGMVYNRFSKILNVDDGVILSPHLPMQISIDFNVNPGTHLNIGQHDRSRDILTVAKEMFGKRWSTVEIMQAFVDWVRQANWQWTYPLEVYGDASGRASSTTNGDSNLDIIISILSQAKIPYVMCFPVSNPAVSERVNSVNIALRDISDQPHIKIHPSCLILIRDYEKLPRDKRGDIDKNSNVELSHSSDADGYRIWYLRPLRKFTFKQQGQFSVSA
jgi:hypothetical protein